MTNTGEQKAFPAQVARSQIKTCGSDGYWYRTPKHKKIRDIKRGGNHRKRGL